MCFFVEIVFQLFMTHTVFKSIQCQTRERTHPAAQRMYAKNRALIIVQGSGFTF